MTLTESKSVSAGLKIVIVLMHFPISGVRDKPDFLIHLAISQDRSPTLLSINSANCWF